MKRQVRQDRGGESEEQITQKGEKERYRIEEIDD